VPELQDREDATPEKPGADDAQKRQFVAGDRASLTKAKW
jgi:hypothetical protein